ncbi:MAG: family 10 glycosylhydrolase [bacterium]|nr:family 10 glycosylhydrolase [bacterium]
MKRIICFIFFVVVSFFSPVLAGNLFEVYSPAINEIVFRESSYPLDVIDPVASTNSNGANYPGLRGANQLVVYTSAFGFRTGTNEFGTEAIINDDTVTSLSGADSLIPVNGAVISGHGKAKSWINENVMVGAKIFIDVENKTITSYITSETFLYAAKERVKEVQEMLAFYCKNCLNYNGKRTEQNLSKAQDFIYKAQNDSEDSQKYSSKAIEYANQAMSTVVPYDCSELKGVWIRPTYYNKKDIETVLDNMQSIGINNVFLETYYHGKTIFPSRTMEKYGFVKQYEDFVGFDPLKTWINEAHKRGIKVHVWFQTFYVGNTPPETNPMYILAVHPEWTNRQKKNAFSEKIPYSVSEHNGYFIDPANPDVQTFLYELLCEIVNRYKPDGINLDYIRYPQSLTPNYSNYDLSNWGYTEYARNEFRGIYGTDPMEIDINNPLWSYWRFYRMSKITDFVKKISYLCRSNKVTLTTVIFPNRANAIDTKLQDWKSWSINNFVDGFTPLFLTCDDKTEANLAEEIIRNKSAATKIYAGLFVTFMNGANTDLIKQIHTSRKYNFNGIIIFDYAHFGENYVDVLTQSILKPNGRDIVISGSGYNKPTIIQFKSRGSGRGR